jgi:hypothetical protein
VWLINGWQTYGKFTSLPGVGFQIDYRPRERPLALAPIRGRAFSVGILRKHQLVSE